MDLRVLRYHYTNSYLIRTSDGWLMFDCDCAGTFHKLSKALKAEAISLGEVNYLLVSHFHPDHAGLAQNLKEMGVILVVMEEQHAFLHVQDAIYAKANDQQFKPILEQDNLYMPCTQTRSFLAGFGINGEVLYTPGHSDDSVSLIIDGEAVFHGDLPPFAQAEAYQNLKISRSWADIMAKQPAFAYAGHWPKILLPTHSARISEIA
ncbi:MAG TPA: MBL fold metallo-hydrolase [Anaerolineaceae bacterium]|nr:MBL fold metallo-hydrolase [Anaerolineaceae bacterium]